MKTCRKCKTEKLVSEFSPRPQNVSDGLCSHCRSCRNETSYDWRRGNSEVNRARRKQLYWENPKRQADACRKSKFGIKPEQYQQLLDSQNGVCAICREKDRSGRALAVDHNHATNHIRGLLCQSCNTAIGLLRDDADLIQRAMDYINSDPVLTIRHLHTPSDPANVTEIKP